MPAAGTVRNVYVRRIGLGGTGARHETRPTGWYVMAGDNDAIDGEADDGPTQTVPTAVPELVGSRQFDRALLVRMEAITDPLADDLVRPLLDEPDGAKIRALMRQLVDNAEIPPQGLPIEVEEYLEASATLPPWADLDRVRRGQAVFQKWGPELSVALFCASLPSAYASARGVNVLAQTARLATDTRRRITETGQFLVDVMAPDGLGPTGKGIRSIQHVRLMHGAVRHLILHHQAAADSDSGPAPWNDAWGRPINQMELAGTLMSFAYPAVESLPRMGINLSLREQEDYLHAWRVVGHLLGVQDEINPASVAEATDLVTEIRSYTFGRSDAGLLMTASLLELLREMTPIRRLKDVPADMMRMLIGDETCDLIGVPPPGRSYGLLGIIKVLLRLTSHEVEQHRYLGRISQKLGFAFVKGMLDIERGGLYRPPFNMPSRLRGNKRF